MGLPAYHLQRGTTPLLISMPHSSSSIPVELANRMHPYAQGCPDTDWLLNPLYAFASELGIGLLRPQYARYVIDLNRPEDDHNLYPGADTTGLCPTTCFDKRPIYLRGQEPDESEIQARIASWWRPYHQALQNETERLLASHGIAIVFEAHSIASVVPRFFEGELPELNWGTASGYSCADSMVQALMPVVESSGYSHVLNGRFKGGYITRAFGQPERNLHAIQLELSQATYLEEETGTWLPGKVARIQPVLATFLTTLLNWAREPQR